MTASTQAAAWKRTGLLLLLTAALAFFTQQGFAWRTLVSPTAQTYALAVGAGVVLLSLWARLRLGWARGPGAFEGLLLLWLAAALLSIAANPEVQRRSVLGLWVMLVYAGSFFMLADVVHRGRMTRELLVSAFLLVGVLAVSVGYVQFLVLAGADDVDVLTVRMGGLMENPNVYAAFLVMLLPFVLARMLVPRAPRPVRWALGGYAALTLLMLLMTNSRSGFLAAAAAVVTVAGLALLDRGMLSPGALRARFRGLSRALQVALLGVGVAALIGGGVAALLLFNSLTVTGRGFGDRVPLWESALTQFNAQPLTGQGLFAYGYALSSTRPIPREKFQPHAHNLVLNVMAELGVLGLLALGASVAVILWGLRRNWRGTPVSGHAALSGAAGALAATSVHHLLDMPSIQGGVALTALLAVAVAAVPARESSAPESRRGGQASTAVLTLAWVLLIGVGVAYTLRYAEYAATYNALRHGGDLAAGVIALETRHIPADPDNALLWHQRALLLGTLAYADESRLSAAITATQDFLALEPYHRAMMANLSALYWQAGDAESAQRWLDEASALLPEYPLFAQQQAVYAGQQRVPAYTDAAAALDLTVLDHEHGTSYGLSQYYYVMLARQFLPQFGPFPGEYPADTG